MKGLWNLRILALIVALGMGLTVSASHAEHGGSVPHFTALVVGVPTPKTLLLDDGRTVRLAAIQIPNIGDAGEGDKIARAAQAWLKANAENKPLVFYPVMDKPDRRGRVVAKAFIKDKWVQPALLEQGLAWVYTFPDTAADADALLGAEKRAERGMMGVWSTVQYQPIAAEKAKDSVDQFRMVKGKIDHIEEHGNKWFVYWYTPLGAPPFINIVERSDQQHFPEDWKSEVVGKNVRIRGWIFARSEGAAMSLTHPEQLEILP